MKHPDVGEPDTALSSGTAFLADRMSLSDVCERWGCDAKTVRRAVRAKKLAEGRRVFGRTYFKVVDVMAAERLMLGETEENGRGECRAG